MKAITHDEFGAPELLSLNDVEPPTPDEHQVLVRVHAAALNPYDWHFLTGTPYLVRAMAGLRRPKQPVRGADVAGVVEAVGNKVTRLAPGDRVFGLVSGSLAELAVGHQHRLARIPDEVSDEQAAATPMAGLTALQALRDKGGLREGQRVLVNGASGGVGTFAVQIARANGAEVIGVCSGANVELVRSLGATRLIDYSTEDFTDTVRECDILIDNVGNRSWRACRRVLAPGGVHVVVGGGTDKRVLGNLVQVLGWRLASIATRTSVTSLLARTRAADLETLGTMLADGTIRAVVERTIDLADAADGFAMIGSGRTRGKIVINLAGAAS